MGITGGQAERVCRQGAVEGRVGWRTLLSKGRNSLEQSIFRRKPRDIALTGGIEDT